MVVGEARAESLVGDAGEAVVGVTGESGESDESDVGAPGSGVAHRGRLLEGDADAAAHGVFDGLFGLVVEGKVRRAVRWARERGGGALVVGELRLVDYGGECSDALASNAVVLETASEGQGGNGGRAMSRNGVNGRWRKGKHYVL